MDRGNGARASSIIGDDMGAQERRVQTYERDRQALELRKAGVSYDEIARRLGWRARGGAHHAVKRALVRTMQEPADDIRKLEAERLDALLLATWAQAQHGNLGAVDRCLNIAVRRAKLLGLDMATLVDVKSDGKGINDIPDDKRLAGIMALYERVRARSGGTDDSGSDTVGPAEGTAS